jgi:hypothetical protein
MEKKEIYSEFLRNGYSLDMASLEFFTVNQQSVPDFLSGARNLEVGGSKRPFIITMEYVRTVLGGNATINTPPAHVKPTTDVTLHDSARFSGGRNKTGTVPKIINTFLLPDGKESHSVEDALSVETRQYEDAKALIVGRLEGELVSINKIQPSGRFSLISVVASKSDDSPSITVQDTTGEVTLLVNDEKDLSGMIEGDIVGLECESGPDGIKASTVVWPDISMKRKAESSESDSRSVFISASPDADTATMEKFGKWMSLNEANSLAFTVFSDAHPTSMDSIRELTNCGIFVDARMPLIASVGGLTILVCSAGLLSEYSPFWGSEENTVINIIKRRNLAPGVPVKDHRFFEKRTFFDTTPDIFVVLGSDSNGSLNYKGTTIILCASSKKTNGGWMVDMKTRDVNKFDLP